MFLSKNYFLYLTTILLLTLLIGFGCKEKSDVVGEDDETGIISLSGQIINNISGIPIEEATIVITGTGETITLKSDSQGKYSYEFESSSNANLVLITYKEGFYNDTTNIFAAKGSTLNVPLIQLEPINTGSEPSGYPVSIFLQSQSALSIGVKESGSEETARLVFVVQDSAGIPVDLAHSVDVYFRFGSAPGGGEILSPNVVKTNNFGQAIVNLTSGTKAGTVQIIAEIDVNGTIITSLPVSIAIHGGLPDQNHFSVASDKLNFPGYNIFGLTNGITAFVGDKYSNPVRVGTSVYFSSTGGIIGGSGTTDEMGRASVDLMSAKPLPDHPIFGPGFATITASSSDENQNIVSDQTIVLFSGIPQILVSPASINVPNGGSQSFNYTVSDQNGNPLASGTSISVSIEGENVDVQGDTDVSIPDTQSKAWTQFGFTVFDTADTINVAKSVTVKIKSTGPNGDASAVISGVAR